MQKMEIKINIYKFEHMLYNYDIIVERAYFS